MDECWFCKRGTEPKDECFSWLRDFFGGEVKVKKVSKDEGGWIDG